MTRNVRALHDSYYCDYERGLLPLQRDNLITPCEHVSLCTLATTNPAYVYLLIVTVAYNESADTTARRRIRTQHMKICLTLLRNICRIRDTHI